MSSAMYAEMGLQLLTGFMGSANSEPDLTNTNRIRADIEHRSRQASQAYQNSMMAISAGHTLAGITDTSIEVLDAAERADYDIQVTSMRDMAVAEVAAAAAGVKGGAVRATMTGLTRSRLQARNALAKRTAAEARSLNRQRGNVLLSKTYGKDVTVFEKELVFDKPKRTSTASSLLGLTAGLIETYDAHQPEGSRSTDAIASLFSRLDRRNT